MDNTKSMDECKKGKIGFVENIFYGCGAAGGNIMNTLLATFLLAYYTDTALINAAAIGTMFVISRLFDGLTDIIMGGIVDKTHTRIGKSRPWIIISAPLMCVGIILILNVPHGWNGAMKLVYAYVTYIFLNAGVYTMFGIAHAALLARMTRDSKDRNTTSVVSSICNNLAGLIAGTAMTAMQLKLGWSLTSVILGIAACILILVPGLTIKERVGMSGDEIEKNKDIPMKKQLSAVLKNKYFYIALLMGALTLLMNANAIGSQVFYCNIVMGEPQFMMQLMSIGQLPGILILFVMPWFANKFSKRNFMLIGVAMLIAGFAVLGFAGKSHVLILTGTIFRSLGAGPIFAGIYAFIADACDYGEWKTGIRSEGLMSASQSIGSKLGIGFGSALTGWILASVNYNPAIQQQSDVVINAITFDFSWMGVIISVVLFICIMCMDVEKYLPEIKKSLNK